MRAFTAIARIFALCVLTIPAGHSTAQQAYPAKPIRFIVPFPPGGTTDALARMTAPKLAEKLGQPVIIDNRPGGNTVIGTDAAAKAPPDGYTILLASITFVTGPSLLASLPYDTIRDFEALATISRSRYLLVLHPSVTANTLRDFIALARSRPGQLNYGSAGVGSGVHLAAELFNTLAGTSIQHIPYKGSGSLIADLVGGQVQLSFQVPIVVIPHIKSGKLNGIAITGETRLAALPQVPTFTEAGLKGLDMNSWQGIVIPAGTPKAIIERLSTEISKIVSMPDIRDKLSSQGLEPFAIDAGQLTALIKADIAMYAKVIKAANIKIEQ